MNAESFNRIKKMVRREGKVVFFDDEESYILMPFADYEELTEDLCGEECECECGKLDEEIFVGDPELGREAEGKNEEVDKELIRKVNEDIAKWREEQAGRDSHNDNNNDNDARKKETAVDLSEVAGEPASTRVERGEPEAKEETLTEEERYYLEPLE